MADLEALETWLSPLLQKLDSRGRAQLARKAAQQLRRSQQQRIRAQANPDGSPFESRKPRDLRGKKGRIKRRMFEKLKMARYLKTKGTPQQAVIGFAGRVSRIARVHQYGLKDRAERGAPEIRYAKRQILGLTEKDRESLVETMLDLLTTDQLSKYDGF
ncbi:phage virion morphogenesis protein [Pseudomonas sp. CBMAI 2609]|uniref:Phage virion morphogenesis protein n=1 Tax=Pseudomonas flavocrustae TaxID=2991719 RepID=A0ABT6IFZ4_9PSED|nr:phage virion morphogenesis protein [Pseudomonas sp. CBMAI 2609]MDH4763412.1 phage virion morphogenesis protein [Pseudomonas sp. CBMAI 2609]